MYPESTATKWRVRIYNIETGYFYDKSTMCNGLYFTRERALAEIDRFKNRAENLIFYVLPISFSYNKEKLSEDIENEYYDYETPVYATENEQIEEAEKRIYALTGKATDDIENMINKLEDLNELNAVLKFNMSQKKTNHKNLPYYIINNMPDSITILYVGADKSYWESERRGINCKKNSGYIAAFVYNPECPVYSEYGDIWYRYSQDKLERIA